MQVRLPLQEKGRIATERILELDRKKAIERHCTIEDIQAEAMDQIPLGRIGTPEESKSLRVGSGSDLIHIFKMSSLNPSSALFQ
jgi:hypothetical protein